MAKPEPKAAPTPPPPPKAVEPEKRVSEAVAAGNTTHGKKYLRPFLYLWKFATGTVYETLEGTSKWATKGMWFGIGVAIVMGLAFPGAGSLFYPIVMGAITGFAGGAAAGGTVGLLTGGIQNVRRQQRAEKYADDLIVHEKAKAAPISQPVDYRSAYQNRRLEGNYITDRLQQQQRELQKDTWQSRVSSGGYGHGRGF